MPRATYKSKGGNKDSAEKNTFNSPHAGTTAPQPQHATLNGPQERDPKHRHGQFGETGNAPLIKK